MAEHWKHAKWNKQDIKGQILSVWDIYSTSYDTVYQVDGVIKFIETKYNRSYSEGKREGWEVIAKWLQNFSFIIFLIGA